MDRYLDLARDQKNLLTMKVMVIAIVFSDLLTDIGKETIGVVDQKKNRDWLDLSILEISRNTEKSPGDLRRLAVTQTPLKDNLSKLVRKTTRNKIIVALTAVQTLEQLT